MIRETWYYTIRGRVQGVGFRNFTEKSAVGLQLTGWVQNMPSGEVEILVTGSASSINMFEKKIRQGPPLARVDRLEKKKTELQDFDSFEIRG